MLYWTRIVFAKNYLDVPFFTKIRANLHGYLGDQYVLYDFKHNRRQDYLSEFDWYRSRFINEPFDRAFNNKVVCSEILQQYIRVCEIYFILNKGQVLDFHNGIKSYEDIIDCLRKKGKLVIKPFDRGKGLGVFLLSVGTPAGPGTSSESGDDEVFYINQTPYTEDALKDFLKTKNGSFLCEFIEQHEYSNRLYDKTTNTIRLITMRNTETHEFENFFAVQRIGTQQTIPVDNGSQGGLVAKIDMATGELSEAGSLHSLKRWETHPDSGNPIKGARIPRWKELLAQMEEVCKHIPYMDFIAWDLVIMPDGEVCVIEANNSSGVNIIQLWGGQRHDRLGHFYRHYKVIK